MKTFDQIREAMNKTENTSDAVKAFLAKGGKIKKLPPAKAQGYHGKDDPGKGMHGMLDKPDTKKIGTRKKVKSMEAVVVFGLFLGALLQFHKSNTISNPNKYLIGNL